ncbi:hypothetical protein GCM10011607_14980 [Shewanella inventionis]|uniref:Uncharacterized protein n=1 Tax=Shewanella inventionis TaxID=1738770 RepID=A0ABQ1J031_9GAMM|nr:hypothetical protein GCM10011607_14980 [Shewanella inventionis]
MIVNAHQTTFYPVNLIGNRLTSDTKIYLGNDRLTFLVRVYMLFTGLVTAEVSIAKCDDLGGVVAVFRGKYDKCKSRWGRYDPLLQAGSS